MRGLEKNYMKRGHQTDRQTDTRVGEKNGQKQSKADRTVKNDYHGPNQSISQKRSKTVFKKRQKWPITVKKNMSKTVNTGQTRPKTVKMVKSS